MRRRNSLRFVGLHQRTLRAYRQALDRFLQYLRRKKLPLRSPEKLDAILADFLDQNYQEGEAMSYSGHLLSAIKRFHPQLRLQLPISSQYFRNWQRCYVPVRAVPASFDLVEAMMGVAFHRSEPILALLFALAFNALLRTSEALSLTHKHVVFHPGGMHLSVIIPGSKTSQGNPQVVLVTDYQLVSLARSLVDPRSSQLLWGHGAHLFRKHFAAILQRLGFGPHDYSPYSLRRGGTTWYFQSTLSLDSTVARGRWACSKTAKIYLDEGTSQLAHVHWSPAQRRLVHHWRDECRVVRLRQRSRKRRPR